VAARKHYRRLTRCSLMLPGKARPSPGALSSPDGSISISGKLVRNDGSGSFVFSWKESGGPRVSLPTRKGFGSVILLDACRQFGAATMNYLPEGLLYELQVDLKEIEAPSNVVTLRPMPKVHSA